MKFVGVVSFVVALGLWGGATAVRAEAAEADAIAEVTVVASRLDAPQPHCKDLSKAESRTLAAEASRQGDHRRAAECYLQAGDNVRADRAYVKATRLAATESSQRVSTTTDDARAQARRIREAFKKR